MDEGHRWAPSDSLRSLPSLRTPIWTWYDSGNDAGTDAPFRQGFDHREILVFRLDMEAQVGEKYCVATPNSTGSPADIFAEGSTSSELANLRLTAAPVPNQNGVFFHGRDSSQIPFGNGYLCAVGGLVRGAVVTVFGNTASITYDNGPKRSLSQFVGTTRHFQYWFRDPMGGGSVFNTSNAIMIDIRH